ncbi:hypothetical protein PUR61_09820 [Streptomyces sp. BE20]|uniref:hypothetical protein n=1 Tax=Streptomyces sp. BE20 TaxID=3002525 RepID=UPI002E76EFCC|nr:hypothetical protein [Streptomyces sp. BE20]MEE1822486.1 hypothetical protein [Streptomyces sp. BE20]
MSTRLRPAMSGAVALTASAALAPLLAVLGELRATWVALAGYAVLCAAVGRCSRPSAAPLVGLAAWLFHNGFVEHRRGTLGWAGPAPETGHLLLFTAAALAFAVLAALRRPHARRRPRPRDRRPGRRFGLTA